MSAAFPASLGDLAAHGKRAVGSHALLDRAAATTLPGVASMKPCGGPQVAGHAVALGALAQIVLGHEVARQHVPEPAAVLAFERNTKEPPQS